MNAREPAGGRAPRTARGPAAARWLLAILVALVALAIAVVIGYDVGYDAGRGSIDCEEGLVLSVDVTGADALGNGTRTLAVGDCDRIDEAAFIAAVEALTRTGATTTTVATATTTTTTATTTTTTTVAP